MGFNHFPENIKLENSNDKKKHQSFQKVRFHCKNMNKKLFIQRKKQNNFLLWTEYSNVNNWKPSDDINTFIQAIDEQNEQRF